MQRAAAGSSVQAAWELGTVWVVPFLSGLCQLELLLQCPKVLPTPYDILSRGLLYTSRSRTALSRVGALHL